MSDREGDAPELVAHLPTAVVQLIAELTGAVVMLLERESSRRSGEAHDHIAVQIDRLKQAANAVGVAAAQAEGREPGASETDH
jgi:hypothetical protein